MSIKRRMLSWLGNVVDEFYSSSEGGGTSITAAEWLDHPGSVGRPYPGTAVKVLDGGGRECHPGETGTVYFELKAPWEYLNDTAATRATRVDNLFTVGDMGYFDNDGYLFLTDRAVDMIISGGVNIYPAEIEAVLLEDPRVADVAVIGVSSQEWGEDVKAIVELRPGVPGTLETADQLIAHCSTRLARFKCPKSVEFVATIPRGATGKISKRHLRETYR
jgi:long-chain acyl-CoA synthetase